MLNVRFGDQQRISQAMKSHFEHKLIGDIVKEYPETNKVLEGYFGKGCLKKEGLESKLSKWHASFLMLIQTV